MAAKIGKRVWDFLISDCGFRIFDFASLPKDYSERRAQSPEPRTQSEFFAPSLFFALSRSIAILNARSALNL